MKVAIFVSLMPSGVGVQTGMGPCRHASALAARLMISHPSLMLQYNCFTLGPVPDELDCCLCVSLTRLGDTSLKVTPHLPFNTPVIEDCPQYGNMDLMGVIRAQNYFGDVSPNLRTK